MENCFVAVSGGVDSAVALLILKNNGYAVSGITMRAFSQELVEGANDNELNDARELCESLGVAHHFVDLSDDFRRTVVADFVDSYARGETPNPCIICNRDIKFGSLLDYSLSHGADKYATGHYVRVKQCGDKKVILRGRDEHKDQSYMLWSLSQEQVSRFVAPLGDYGKDEVRDIARENGFLVADKGDSQDICFIPDGDYRAFLDRVSPEQDRSGDFVHKNGTVLGRHLGQRCYTIGQRKGLGIAYTEPLYVIGRDINKNQIILGSNSDLFTNRFTVRSASFSALDFPSGSIRCEVRIRYHAPFVSATVTPIGDTRLLIETDTPVRAATAGQSAVFYDGDTLLGGGIIESGS